MAASMSDKNTFKIGELMTRAVRCIEPEANLAECAAIMRDSHISSVVVTRQQQPVGIITERDILAAINQSTPPHTPVYAVMGQPIVSVREDADYRDAFHRMVVHRIRHLLVVDAVGALVGVVSETDFRRRGGIEEFVGLLDVSSAMDPTVPILPGNALVADAAACMEGRRRATCILVGEGEGMGRRVLGIVTERDMVRLFLAGSRDLSLQQVMTQPVLAVTEASPLVEAARLMQLRNVRHLVVESELGVVLGVLSEHDLVKHTEDAYVDLLQEVIRKQAEELLRQQEQLAAQKLQAAVADTEFRYRNILEQLPQKIVVKDKDLRYLICNSNFAASQGKTITEMVGSDDLCWFPAELAEHYRAEDRRAMLENQVLRTEEPFLRQGEERWIRNVRAPLKDTLGRVCGVIGIAEDVTEARRLRQEILDLNAGLEQRVAQRTRQLELANHDLECMARTLSHDLRLGLRTVNACASLLEEKCLSKEGDGTGEISVYLGRIRRGSLDMADLMEAVLSYSAAGGGDLKQEEVDMEALAREVVTERRSHYPLAEIQVGPLPQTRGDRRLLRQVWANLIDNALKFSSRRDVAQVAIVCRRREDGGLAYGVSDNGPGIDPVNAAALFEPFHRDAAGDLPGHGIGLSIVKRVVERHGGQVWAEVVAQGGAAFWFSLPAAAH